MYSVLCRSNASTEVGALVREIFEICAGSLVPGLTYFPFGWRLDHISSIADSPASARPR